MANLDHVNVAERLAALSLLYTEMQREVERQAFELAVLRDQVTRIAHGLKEK